VKKNQIKTTSSACFALLIINTSEFRDIDKLLLTYDSANYEVICTDLCILMHLQCFHAQGRNPDDKVFIHWKNMIIMFFP